MTVVDVAVVGAGPAGLAAAVAAAEAGAGVLVVDESGTAGGQYLHPRHDRTMDHPVARRFATSGAELLLGEAVWHVDPDGRRLHTLRREIGYRSLVLATGAFDRPFSIPGWRLPGVLTAGAAQRLSKEGVRLGRSALVAGSGPFAMPVALELVAKGTAIAEIALTHFPWMGTGSLHAPQILAEGARLAARAATRRLWPRTGWVVTRILGDSRVEGAVLTGLPSGRHAGKCRTVSCDLVALGYGFLPQLAVADLAGCAVEYDRVHRTWFVTTDPHTTRTSVPGVFAAGEITGIGGHRKALAEGRLAGFNAATAAKRPSGARPDASIAAVAAQVPGRVRAHVMRRFATGARRSLAPPPLVSLIADEAVVCRCENVTAGAIRAAAADGARTVQGVRMRTRCGMGECQSRICGQLCGEIIEERLGLPAGTAGRIQARPPARPVALGEILA